MQQVRQKNDTLRGAHKCKEFSQSTSSNAIEVAKWAAPIYLQSATASDKQFGVTDSGTY